MKRHICFLTLIVGLIHASGTTVAAQEVAGSFDQLRVLVKPGDRISVVDDKGTVMRGTISREQVIYARRGAVVAFRF